MTLEEYSKQILQPLVDEQVKRIVEDFNYYNGTLWGESYKPLTSWQRIVGTLKDYRERVGKTVKVLRGKDICDCDY